MLTAATGLNREALRGPVATALRRVLKDQGTVYENMRGAGYRRVDDADLANIGQRAIEKGRRVHAVAVGAAGRAVPAYSAGDDPRGAHSDRIEGNHQQG
jgi:hypothetical protein